MNPDINKSGCCRSPLVRSANGVDNLLGSLSSVSLWLARLSGALVVVTAVLVSMEVLLRKLTRVSVSFTHELSGYALAIVFALSLAYALMSKAHIRIDVLYLGAAARIRRLLDILALLLLNVFSFVLVDAAWDIFALSYARDSISNTTLATPLWIPQGVWLIGLIVFAVAAALLLIRVLLSVLGAVPERAEQLIGAAGEAGPPPVASE